MQCNTIIHCHRLFYLSGNTVTVTQMTNLIDNKANEIAQYCSNCRFI